MSLADLQNRLGYVFREESLLQLALTHPSAMHGLTGPREDNQRLEFLGDSVLNLMLARALYDQFPAADEGVLSKFRARLVNDAALAARGGALGLGELLRMNRGEEGTGGRARPSSLADAFEAVIGAVFLDGGEEAARGVILREFGPSLDELALTAGVDNPKGKLQERLQSESKTAPQYQVIATEGPGHDRVFTCSVSHAGVELARGVGKSKKAAETAAAQAALAKGEGEMGHDETRMTNEIPSSNCEPAWREPFSDFGLGI